MIDADRELRDALERLVPAPRGGDWDEVLALAGRTAATRWPRGLAVGGACALAAAALAAVALATPLGSAIARGVGGFSAWVSGEPGRPAPAADQRAFARANHRYLGFPAGTKLRLLAESRRAGTTVQLLGFRSGSTLCLRVQVRGPKRGSMQSCAPLAALRRDGSPARVLLVDWGFGLGRKHAWYGLERVHSSVVQVTAGIVTDGVRSVTVRDSSGSRTVPARANAFLDAAWNPDVGQRVSRISATTATRTVAVPFTPAAFGFGAFGPATGRPTGPARVQRRVRGGTIGWLDHRRPVGQPLSVLPARLRRFIDRHVVFGRVIAPDPGAPLRVAVTLSTSRHGGRATGVCTWLISNGGGAGGCAVRARLFAQGPVGGSSGSDGGGSEQYSVVTGLASDVVARIVAHLANGRTQAVPLADNVYSVRIASSSFPVRLVGYDAAGRIVAVGPILRGHGPGAGPARGKAKELLHVVAANGGTATLSTGPSTAGGTCMYMRTYFDKHHGGTMVGCAGRTWEGPAIQLGGGGFGGVWDGRVRPDVAKVELRFSDGRTATIRPTRGFVLYAVPKSESSARVLSVTGYDAAGKIVGREALGPPPHRRR